MQARTRRSLLVLCASAVLVAACEAAATPAPASPSTTSARTPVVATASPVPSLPSPDPTPSPTAAPIGSSPTEPARLPVRARGGAGTAELVALGDGRLLAAIPARGGDVLALLDTDGQPAPGWPVRLRGRADCRAPLATADGLIRIVCGEWDHDGAVYAFDAQGGLLPGWPARLRDGRCTTGMLPAADGSVRVVCERRSSTDSSNPDHLVFALDRDGAALPGWPVTLGARDYVSEWTADPAIAADTVMLVSRAWVEHDERFEDWLVTIDRSGTVTLGRGIPTANDARTAIGPDGVAYQVEDTDGSFEGSRGRITAFDLDGVRPGWPIAFRGMGSQPAFGPDGRIYVTVGDANRGRSRVLAFDRDGGPAVAVSPWLRLASADPGVDCVGGPPEPPVVLDAGTVVVSKFTEARTYALDPVLRVRRGWPYTQPKGSPPDPCAGADGLCCDWPYATPRTSGPDGSLYVVLNRASAKAGGRIAAIGPDGRMRTGWPVELRRPGSMFLAIEPGPDGIVHALAIEAEGGTRASATILAIGADGEVRWHTTVADR